MNYPIFGGITQQKTRNILSTLQGGLSALFNNHFHLYFNNLFTLLNSFQNILDLPQEKCIFLKNYSFWVVTILLSELDNAPLENTEL